MREIVRNEYDGTETLRTGGQEDAARRQAVCGAHAACGEHSSKGLAEHTCGSRRTCILSSQRKEATLNQRLVSACDGQPQPQAPVVSGSVPERAFDETRRSTSAR